MSPELTQRAIMRAFSVHGIVADDAEVAAFAEWCGENLCQTLLPLQEQAASYGFTSVLQAVTTAGQYIQGKKPDVAPSTSAHPSLVPPKTYLVTIVFEDGTFRGRATSSSDLSAYSLVLQDARMASASGPQYHGKVLDWKAQDVAG